MLNRIVRDKTVWSFNCVYLQNVFINYESNSCKKTGFGIKWLKMVDVP